MKQRSLSGQRGFTLLEIIVTIIIASIMVMVLMPFSQTLLRGSAQAVMESEQLSEAHSVLENITSAHMKMLITEPQPLEALRTKLAGGGAEFGTFEVEECKYIAFDGSFGLVNATTEKNLLLVTIKVGEVRLTAIFGE